MNGTCQGGDALLFARTRTDVSFFFIIASTDFCSFYFFFPMSVMGLLVCRYLLLLELRVKSLAVGLVAVLRTCDVCSCFAVGNFCTWKVVCASLEALSISSNS